jgi:hypothetical protein
VRYAHRQDDASGVHSLAFSDRQPEPVAPLLDMLDIRGLEIGYKPSLKFLSVRNESLE